MSLIDIKKKYKQRQEKMKVMVKIDKANLNGEMITFSSKMFSLGVKKIEAEYLMDKAKARIEIIKAKAEKKIRNSPDKQTEKEISAKLVRHPEVMKAHDEYLEAKYLYGIMGIGVTSLSKKSDMLSNLAFNYRKEMDYGYVKESKEKRVKEKSNNNRVNKRRRNNG